MQQHGLLFLRAFPVLLLMQRGRESLFMLPTYPSYHPEGNRSPKFAKIVRNTDRVEFRMVQNSISLVDLEEKLKK